MAIFGGWSKAKARQAKKSGRRATESRRASFEPLEPRCLLSVSLPSLPSTETVLAGEPLMVALTGSGATKISYSVKSSGSGLVATILPSTNRVIDINVSGTLANGQAFTGDMDFELFDNFTDLDAAINYVANLVTGASNNGTPFYNSAPGDTTAADDNHMIFFRDDSDVLQAGSTNNDLSPSGGGSGASFDDAYDSNVVYSSAGILAMAKPADSTTGQLYSDANDSQFFITNKPELEWDFQYTIIGFEVRGQNIQQDIEGVPTTENPSTDMLQPNTPVIINSISVISDTQDGVLELNAPSTTKPGTYTVTVTSTDASNPADTTQNTITVTVGADTTIDPPYFKKVPDITTTAGKAATITLPAYVPAGNTPYFLYDSGTPSSGAVSITSFNNLTGQLTVTPAAGFAGVTEIYVEVVGEYSTYNDTEPDGESDTQYVPVLVTPPAPTGLTLLSPSVTGTTAVNNSLQFQVSNVYAGCTVTLYCDGTAIGSASATAATMTITANSSTTLADGAHTFTVSQNYASNNIDIANDSEAVNLVSPLSSALKITVDTKPGQTVTLPSGLTTNQFTLRRSGVNLQVVNDKTGAIVQTVAIASTSSLQIVGAANTAEQLTVDLNYGGAFTLPLGVTFTPGSGSPADVLVVRGPNVADTFTLNATRVAADGLTVLYSGVQKIQLDGGSGADDYVLNSSPANVAITDPGGANTLDFSGDSAGITLNLGLTNGQAQTIAPWGKTLTLQGTFQNLVGTAYADVLTGGSTTCVINSGGGNDVLRAGTGNAVLVGGGGNDTLYAGAGASVLIGGSGASTLYGSGGSSVLVGGTTSFDTNDQALLGVLNDLVAKGLATSRVRTSLLSSTAGSSDPYALAMGATVQDNGQKDTLVSGTGVTWFLPGAHDVLIGAPGGSSTTTTTQPTQTSGTTGAVAQGRLRPGL